MFVNLIIFIKNIDFITTIQISPPVSIYELHKFSLLNNIIVLFKNVIYLCYSFDGDDEHERYETIIIHHIEKVYCYELLEKQFIKDISKMIVDYL